MSDTINLADEFSRHLFEQFLISQRKYIAVLLKDCKASYNAKAGALIIECETSRLARVIRTKADKIVIPALLGSAKILIRSPSGDIQIRSKEMANSVAPALTELEAIEAVNSSELAATIFLFVKHGLRPIHANSKAAETLKQPVSEMLADRPALLFRYSDNAMRSLNQLESLLLKHGKVQEFELVSEKANGDHGIYIVDATYVRWAGQDARLTIYRTYTLTNR